MSGGRRENDEYRAFIRAHHPDRGGDPAAFAERLAELRARRGRDPRFEAPVVGGAGPRRGLRGITDKLHRWYLRRYRKPRVR
ncbi:hypothetical protein ACFPM7_12310 [Actinokineospora guangxiensis]|uniref:J domain-containing protein n=1 Tax=Actinokineospora guangxiensis TaxID=1490288 RepID=A0ABW0EK79_9PSEU